MIYLSKRKVSLGNYGLVLRLFYSNGVIKEIQDCHNWTDKDGTANNWRDQWPMIEWIDSIRFEFCTCLANDHTTICPGAMSCPHHLELPAVAQGLLVWDWRVTLTNTPQPVPTFDSCWWLSFDYLWFINFAWSSYRKFHQKSMNQGMDEWHSFVFIIEHDLVNLLPFWLSSKVSSVVRCWG